MQKTEYKQVFAISQSAIKTFKTKSLQKFKKIYIDKEKDEDEDESKFAFGSLVDTLAFEPHLLEERFYIPENEIPIPGEKVKLIVDKVYKEAKQISENIKLLNKQGNLPAAIPELNSANIFDWEDLILKYAKEINYGGTTWTQRRILNSVFEDGAAYYAGLNLCNDRQIINAALNADAIQIVEVLRTDKNTIPYFVQQPDETLLFQQEIYITQQLKSGKKAPLKGALDILRINHKDQTVTVADLKSTYDVSMFKDTLTSFGYVSQVSFYDNLVREFLKTFENGKYKNYTMLNPINIAIDSNIKIPYIYEYDWNDIEIAREGSEINNVEGWMNTLENIMWHIETSVWDRAREMFENNKIKLKIFKK